jgi:signal transduction histidine kinase
MVEAMARARTVLPGISRMHPWLLGVVLFGFSVLAALQTYRSADADERIRFARSSERVLESLTFRVRGYVNALIEARGLFMVAGIPDRDGFARFVENLGIRSRFPGMQGIGFAQYVRAEDLDAFEEQMRNSGAKDFRVWPKEPPRPETAPVVLLEPRDWRNERAIGFDMFSEPVRRAAMIRARDTGEPAATQAIKLVQETSTDTQKGFNIYVPVHARGQAVHTVEDRRLSLVGWIFGPFRAGDLFNHLLGEERLREVAIRIYDGQSADSSHLLYEAGIPDHATLRRPRLPLRLESRVDVAGHAWTVELSESLGGGLDATWQALAVLLAGSVISTLIVRAVQVAEQHAAVQNELLANEQAAHQLAQQAVRSREAVLSMVSHDLRNPLNAAQLSGQVLARVADSEALPEADRRAAKRATNSLLRSTERMRLLLADLLDLARIDTGGVSVDAEPNDIGDIIREAIDLQLPLAEQRGLQLRPRVAEGLPRVLCDRSRVLQILANLIGNAIKFTPSGGSIDVEARPADDGQRVEVLVRDTGRGIDPQHLPHVFERYWQAEGSDRRGVGLGLFIARSLVEAQGGTIEADSEPGKGSTFRFRLPAVAPGLSAGASPHYVPPPR